MARAKWEGDEPLRISNSEIQTFKSCKRKWYLTYYRSLGLKYENDKATGPAQLGTKVHVALDELYTNDANPITVIDGLYDVDIELNAENEDIITELKKEQDLAHAMLEGFMEWREEEGIDVNMELVAAEQVVEVKSPVEGVNIKGKLDQRWVRKSDNVRLFRDWKTVANLSEPAKMLGMDEQMKFYHLLEYLESLEVTGNEPQWPTDGGLYTMLRKVKRTHSAKPPFYGQLEVRHNKHELRSMWLRTARILEDIVLTRQELDQPGSDHRYITPPRPSRDCTWSCPFYTICAMMDDGSNVEQMIDEYYEVRDPDERYKSKELQSRYEAYQV